MRRMPYNEKKFFFTQIEAKKTPVKCEKLSENFGFPRFIIAKRMDTGELFECYVDFGTYRLDQYNEALKDAKIQEKRIIH